MYSKSNKAFSNIDNLDFSIKNEYDIFGEKYSECHEILHVSAVIPVI